MPTISQDIIKNYFSPYKKPRKMLLPTEEAIDYTLGADPEVTIENA